MLIVRGVSKAPAILYRNIILSLERAVTGDLSLQAHDSHLLVYFSSCSRDLLALKGLGCKFQTEFDNLERGLKGV